LEETLDLSKPRKESGSALHRIQRQVSEGYKGMFDVLKYSSTLKIVILIAIYRTFFASMIGDFTIVYATNVINITTAQWGFIVSVTGLITTVFKFFSGNLIDWFGKRRIILVTLVCEPIYNILFIYSQTFMHVLNMIIFRSIINSLLEPASEGYFADLVPREKRGRAIAAIGANLFGRSMTGYLRFIPLTLGSFLSGYIYKTDPKYPWLIFSISSIVGIVLSLIYVKEQKEEEE
jgi:MFS family permease